ncbi:cysteine hydrolase family protein [Nocardia pseudovaccinii]|uniref:cysteine hydrolase family protein n=1 Tax=Nocardia pseudovaccinii TaxID=189540 RepID=UPI0007A4E23C|nr:isochorismatase family cysteine hydrolase [Nocardia pseudovaccinii]
MSGRRAAVVIHEWQRVTVDPSTATVPGLAEHARSRGATDRINAITTAARAADMPVVWSTIEPRRDRIGTSGGCLVLAGLINSTLAAGTELAELHPDLVTMESDIWIRRVHGLTPFHHTELESYLRQLRVETVIFGGVSTNIGVIGGVIEAVNRGFSVVVPEDCIAGSSPEVHDFLVAHQLRLVATITDSASVVAALTAISTGVPA